MFTDGMPEILETATTVQGGIVVSGLVEQQKIATGSDRSGDVLPCEPLTSTLYFVQCAEPGMMVFEPPASLYSEQLGSSSAETL